MQTSEDSLLRIAEALERVAGSLEYFEQLAHATRPAPRLVVRREPGNNRSTPAVNLAGDGRLNVTIYNEGEVAAQVSRPEVQFGDEVATGVVVGGGNQRGETGHVDPRATVDLEFLFDHQARAVVAGSPLVLRVPHSPGRYPFGTIFEVHLVPTGIHNGRHGWSTQSSREVPDRAAA